jgi:Helicase conserved C-terminal domain
MPPRRAFDGRLTVREAFDNLTLDELRPLMQLVGDTGLVRKADMIPAFARALTDPARVRKLYDGLDDAAKAAVRLAVHDDDGEIGRGRYSARFRGEPKFDTGDPLRNSWELSWAEQRRVKPTVLRLFFPDKRTLPTDLHDLLRAFVLPLDPFELPTLSDEPKQLTRLEYLTEGYGSKPVAREATYDLRVRYTALDASDDLRAVLRLADAGKLRVTDKKRLPTDATVRAVSAALTNGDFHTPDDLPDDEWLRKEYDVHIKAFAWPLLVLAGGFAEQKGDALRLTASGRAALTGPPHEALRALWRAWLKCKEYDEFLRVDALQGKEGARLSAVPGRRAKLAEALAACPPGRWFLVDDYCRFLLATDRDFALLTNTHALYIAERHYGTIFNATWAHLHGRYVLGFLMECAATLGLIDVALMSPCDGRPDFHDWWGTDDVPFLSRWDGLMVARVNELGAWCMGHAAEYVPPARAKRQDFRVLANCDVVAEGELPAAVRLTLDRFAESKSERVWHLSPERVIGAVEEGATVDDLRAFLALHAVGDIPPAVQTFLNDLAHRVGKFADDGPARVIACADGILAAELMAQPKLKGKLKLADSRFLVVREADLPALRTAFRKLGHVWPLRD